MSFASALYLVYQLSQNLLMKDWAIACMANGNHPSQLRLHGQT
jgi:hypothetical protein